MYVKKDKIEKFWAVTSENFQKKHVQEFTETDQIEDFRLLLDEIAKAKQMFDAGILTEQEFSDLKAKLISKL